MQATFVAALYQGVGVSFHVSCTTSAGGTELRSDILCRAPLAEGSDMLYIVYSKRKSG